MVRCLTSTYPSIRTKTCTRVGLIGPQCKGKASTRADACVCKGDLRLSSYRRRFQTGENRETLAHMCTMKE